jgi:hypothetical protein
MPIPIVLIKMRRISIPVLAIPATVIMPQDMSMKRAAIRRKRRMERRRNGQFKIVLKESDKKALKRALPFIAVGSALWLMLTAGGAHKKTARAISMLK